MLYVRFYTQKEKFRKIYWSLFLNNNNIAYLKGHVLIREKITKYRSWFPQKKKKISFMISKKKKYKGSTIVFSIDNNKKC